MRSWSEHDKRFLARVHFWILGVSLFGYLAFGFVLGPKFFVYDVLQKIRVLADDIIVVTATVLGPPETPVVTATPSCVSGNPRITLDWANDAATSTWDIERDSNPLVTGLTSSSYIDTAVTGTNTYSYVVTAYGPMDPGIATSAPVSATAIDCATLLPPATLTLTHLGDLNITPPRNFTIRVEEDKPKLKGNTNVENAIVDIVVTEPTIITRIYANSNGYFTWTPHSAFHIGRHTLTVTVTDPNDSSRTKTETLTFFVHETDNNTPSSPFPTSPEATPLLPSHFDFTLAIRNISDIHQGGRISIAIKPVRGLLPTATEFVADLIDKDGKFVYVIPSTQVTPGERPGFDWLIDVPRYIPEGNYTLLVTGTADGISVGHSVPITLQPLPLFQLNNRVITYAEAASWVGWIFFSFLFLLALFLFFFLREYGLYLHSVRHITEQHLGHFIMLSLRKGVRK